MRPASCIVTYLSTRTSPVSRSISTPQKSKTKPYTAELLISSASLGAASSGGVQNTVSRKRRGPWIGERAWRPMARGGDTRKAQRIFRVAAAPIRPPAKQTSSGRKLSCGAAMRASLSLRRSRREMRRTGDRAGKAARIIAGGDRPGVLGRYRARSRPGSRPGQAENVGDHLGRDGAVALALRRRVDDRRDAAERVERDGRCRLRAVLGAGPPSLLGGQHGGDVAHIGDRRLDDSGIADAVEPALGAAPRRGGAATRRARRRVDRAHRRAAR